MQEIIRLNNLSEIHSSQNENAKLTDKDIERVDELFDKMAQAKEEVQHTLDKNDVSYYMEMSGIHTELNKNYADLDTKEYILNEKDYDEAAKYIDLEENDEMMLGFTNMDCENLERFIEAESILQPELKCEKCRKRECDECSMLRDKY